MRADRQVSRAYWRTKVRYHLSQKRLITFSLTTKCVESHSNMGTLTIEASILVHHFALETGISMRRFCKLSRLAVFETFLVELGGDDLDSWSTMNGVSLEELTLKILALLN